MPTQKKIDQVATISECLANSAGLFVVDYRGLTVAQFEKLRRELRANGAHAHVFKNNLVRRALASAEMPDMGEILDGTNAVVFFDNDAAAAGKVLKNAAKETKILVLKGGIVDGAVVDAEMAAAIADLPSRVQLLATVLATMLNPMSQIARVVDLIREQKEAEAAA